MTASLIRIQQKLDRLRVLDGACAQFGARSHRYRLGPSLTEAGLQSYERQLGVTLPSDYGQFLSQVGHGGAGPYYGLFTLDSKDPECLTAFGKLSKPFRWTEPFNPETWEYPGDEEGVEWDDDGKFVGMFLPGALYLCNYGCALRFFLIVTGPCKGEVWHDWQADNTGVYPAVDGQGRRLGFLEWYEGWLDRSLSALGEKPDV
jgi:hypothetical protein